MFGTLEPQRMRRLLIHTLAALLVVSAAVPAGRAQNDAQPNAPQNDAPQNDAPKEDAPAVDVDTPPAVSVLEEAKVDAIVELLMTSYAAALAMHVAIRGAECTPDQPRCAPLFFAHDVILGPWNVVKLLRVTHEQADPDGAVFERRDYPTPDLPPAGVLPADLVSLAEYAMEQQVILYEHLEAWQVTLERLIAAIGRNDEPAISAQRRALDAYSSGASTAAASASAASLQFLESLTPLMRHFASAISVEDEESAKDDLRDNGFGPHLLARFASLRIAPADRDALRDEIFAVVGDAPVDLMDGLGAVARGYDRLADLTAVSADAPGNLRPLAHAGTDSTVPSGAGNRAAVILTGTGSTDPEGDTLQYLWTTGGSAVSGPQPAVTLPIGVHHIALTVSDLKGGTDVDLVTVTVSNAAAPIISEVTATPDVLSPANRRLVPVNVTVTVSDDDDAEPFCQVVSVGINEAASEPADAPDEPDVVLDGTLTVLLRAEQSGGKTNRVYSVTVQCSDKSNHTSLQTVFVSVPR